MSYRLTYTASIAHFPDGAGPLEQNNGSVLTFQGSQVVISTGATRDAITGANLTTAATAMGTDISNQMNVNAVLTQIQNFASGGN